MMMRNIAMFCIVVALLAGVSKAAMQDDEKDCANEITNLASCIPFVSGTANKPTPQCCQETQKVKDSKPKCLCVLIKESNDQSAGLPINTTLALQMPSACKIDAKVSDCPSLLKLPADSPDAKIFKDADSSSSAIPNTGSLPPTSGSSSPSGPSSYSESKSANASSSEAKMDSHSCLGLLLMILSTAWMFF